MNTFPQPPQTTTRQTTRRTERRRFTAHLRMRITESVHPFPGMRNNSQAGAALVFHRQPDFLPEFFSSSPPPGRVGNNACFRVFLCQSLKGVPQLVGRKPVALRGDDQEGTSARAQELEQLLVTGLWRHVDVHEREAQCQARALPQIRLDEA